MIPREALMDKAPLGTHVSKVEGAVNGQLAVALVSGGIDSPVAVARMVTNGWSVVCLHCSQEPITGPEAEEKTITSLRHLRGVVGSQGGEDPLRVAGSQGGEVPLGVAGSNSGEGPLGVAGSQGGEGPLGVAGPLGKFGENIDPQLCVVPVGEALSKFTEPDSHRDYFVHMKRLFNGLACRLADEVGATHLLTGENLGQVSSQTLGNLGAVERASDRPILRPLLGLDKQEIIDEARVLGTFTISEGPELCDALGPRRPTTVANLGRLRSSEEALGGLEKLVSECTENRRFVSIDG
jgi:thiamine biosynthesis protein ThiI